MIEDMDLTPEVRAVQEFTLNQLAEPWPCDFDYCTEPGAFGGAASCCPGTLLLCDKHTARLLKLIASAQLRLMPLPCMHCGTPHPDPVKPSHLYSHSFHLTITAADRRTP